MFHWHLDLTATRIGRTSGQNLGNFKQINAVSDRGKSGLKIIYTLVHLYICTLAHLYICTLVHLYFLLLYFSTFVLLYICTFVFCTLVNL